MPAFLLEIGLEEIPARMIAPAQAELARRVEDLLTRERLIDASEGLELHSYSTPRRLAVLVKHVHESQADTEEQLTGPSWAVAFKDGQPTPAAQAFAKKAGVDIAALMKTVTPKGEYVSATVHRKGRTASEILAEQLPKEIASIYWPKNMYWRAGKPERFVRPLKWLVAILGHQIVPVEFAGVTASNVSRGHRILHEGSITFEHAGDYLGQLEAAYVTADVELRRHRIRKALDAATRLIPGARWREDEPLVDTVTHLTEWPTVLLGSFDASYLTLPEEVLVTVMRDHQKYFAIEDAAGKLAPYFLTVLNTQPEEHGDEIIRHGNERVLRARFNDARFFWDVDQKTPLTARLEMLKTVTFQKDLGSYYAKTEANIAVAERLAGIAQQRGAAVDAAALITATRLAKTDLTAELVKEFTELQGIVGGLYARAQGLGESVAQAIYWQYSPAGVDDPIAPTAEGQLLGLADRFQTIQAMFSIGLEPSGSKDPFGLRRAANGIVKILAESGLPLKLSDLLAGTDEAVKAKLAAFFRERVEFYLREVKGFAYDVVNAVLAAGCDDVRDAIARAEALTAVRGSADFIAISAAFKRIKNILRQAEEKKITASTLAATLFADDSERTLHAHITEVDPQVVALSESRNYREALERIATLRPDVDLFFDKVMVMVEDEAVRGNRLALLAQIQGSFSSIADFSEIVTA
ncbi:glycine--tRNA ligase subunit beta [Silvibacterium dinghuense]|uniref:Glycine--tRNA ligase beta subunit n=1 Tax=Silvibacterium dinghuense TaxID=1560006 RepID=A0A4Q1SHX1_9BACT|nr:glycine--tRNA ligase subunit beta [Silvibacterium dinghuense]RXS96985.1 glycine--tRNA ligase subunit beta [Silvibacterium dinghuense]GGG95238.1 glycine--tRNA ligase beta subunit [Silvibacterium dinghuense]